MAESGKNGCLSKFVVLLVLLALLSTCTHGSDAPTSTAESSHSQPAASSSASQAAFDYENAMKGTIYLANDNKNHEFKAGSDIPVGTYLFIVDNPTGGPGWIAIQTKGQMGGGGGYVSWGIMPVREGQVLLAHRVRFCLLDECDAAQIPEDVPIFQGRISNSPYVSTQNGSGKYDDVVSAAESLKEQYPDMSWSSQWEELMDQGYSNEEIAWAIGG